MTLMSDRDIYETNKRYMMIHPYDKELLQPASYDLTLGPYILVKNQVVRLPYEMQRFDFLLGSSVEYLTIPDDIAAKFEGKSSLGRSGLMTHITAGFVDPGFNGNLTVELFYVGYKPFLLEEGMRIGQLAFNKLTSPAVNPYYTKGHYRNQVGPTGPNPESYLPSQLDSQNKHSL